VAALAATIPCPVCGTPFERVQRSHVVGTCSVRCAGLLRRGQSGKSKYGRTCEVCEATYDASVWRQRTCGVECGKELRRRERLAREPERSEPEPQFSRVSFGVCAFAPCSRPFCRRPRTRKKFCSIKCGNDAWNAENKKPELPCMDCGGHTGRAIRSRCDRCAQRHRRDAKRRARGQVEGYLQDDVQYTLWEIAERDGFRCGVVGGDGCGQWVNVFLTGSAKWGPTIDHIVPVSFSRDDRRSNVQLMHRACNTAKSDQVSLELLKAWELANPEQVAV
jgi:hypothetical protein